MNYKQQTINELSSDWKVYELSVDCYIDGEFWEGGDTRYVLAHEEDIRSYPSFNEIITINDAPYREVYARDGQIHKVRAA